MEPVPPTVESNVAIFVAGRSAMDDRSGGVQICTREYIDTLNHAGFSLSNVVFDTDRSLFAKVARRFFAQPYHYHVADSIADEIVSRCRAVGAKTIFLNQCDILAIVDKLRQQVPDVRLIFLSHGLESVDYIHTIRSERRGKSFEGLSRSKELRLGRQLIEEYRQRESLCASVCLSPIEVEIERWLGAKHVTWLPRVVTPVPFSWAPVPNRVGFVGTLGHPPNTEGLLLFLRELDKRQSQLKIRVIGGPKSDGASFAANFKNGEYLGSLSDDELIKEAQSWQCFLHPLFCYPRGASTKLAIGLSWALPVVTTQAGCRGYEWREGQLTVGDTPVDFVDRVLELTSCRTILERAKDLSLLVRDTSPNIAQVAAKLKQFIAAVPTPKQ